MTLNQNIVSSWQAEVRDKKAQRTYLAQEIANKNKTADSLVVKLENVQVARSLIQRAAQLTQEKLSLQLGELVSMALRAVFDDPYEFNVVFETKRNSTECVLEFTKDGKSYKPLDSCGYGAADVASFALRISYWSLGTTNPIMVWDEPFRHLSTELQVKAAAMISKISHKLGIQMILITHSEELAESADKVFTVSMDGKFSQIKEEK